MILQEIRSRTAINHTRLEQSNLLLPFSNSSINLNTYVQILQKFYGYFSPIEQVLDAYQNLLSWLPDYTERRKTKFLIEDLQYLGEPHSHLPLCTEIPHVASIAQAFGCLYVMEGSTLGGKIIYKVLREKLQLEVNRGASYFYGYGDQTGYRWKTFGQALQLFCESTGEDETVIETANQTFTKLEKWLQTAK